MLKLAYDIVHSLSIFFTLISPAEVFEKGLVVGLVVSVLAFYNGNLRSNPVVVYNFSEKLLLKRTKGDVDFFYNKSIVFEPWIFDVTFADPVY